MEDLSGQRSVDEMLDALADERRRKLLVAMLDHNPQDVSPVVFEDTDAEVHPFDRLVEVEHVHLPKLEEYGFIDWDRQSHDVAKGRNFDEIRPLVELVAEHGGDLISDRL